MGRADPQQLVLSGRVQVLAHALRLLLDAVLGLAHRGVEDAITGKVQNVPGFPSLEVLGGEQVDPPVAVEVADIAAEYLGGAP